MNKADFTHYGWLYGLVPVYVNRPEDDCPKIVERHWCLIPWSWLCEKAFGAWCIAATAIDPDFEPMFPIKLTGKIHEQ